MQLVALTAEEVRRQAGQLGRPGWALSGQPLTPRLIEDIEIWRAATGGEPTDRRVLGPVQLDARSRTWQDALEKRLQFRIPSNWADMLTDLYPEIHNDPFAVSLTHRIAALNATGVPVSEMLGASVADGPLPAEQPAAALWWRLSRHLEPAEHNTMGELPDPDQPRTRRSQQSLEERWRDWANQVNPVWVKSEHWQAIAEQLDRADLVIMDTTRLSQRFRESPASSVLAILKDYNDPGQTGQPQQRTEPPQMTVNEHHLRHLYSGSRPMTAPHR